MSSHPGAVSSAGERFPDTEEVAGSIPVPRTKRLWRFAGSSDGPVEQRIAKTFKGARWSLLKNPADLTDTQTETLREMKRSVGSFGVPINSKKRCVKSSPAT